MFGLFIGLLVIDFDNGMLIEVINDVMWWDLNVF